MNRPPKKRARGTRLPDNWQPSAKLVKWVREDFPNIDGRLETEKFRDYWAAKPGKDGTKLDWDATFRNWIRNARPSARGYSPQAQPPRIATADQRLADGMALAARLAAEEQQQRLEIEA